MRLTAFTDYSLRVLMFLAARPGRRATIGEIAAAFAVSENHLTKVVHFLGRQGWISTVRGHGGGLALAKPAAEIRIGDVVRDTEGQAMPAECFASDTTARGCAIAGCCRLRGVLDRAVGAFYAVLDGCTLEEIAANRSQLERVLMRG